MFFLFDRELDTWTTNSFARCWRAKTVPYRSAALEADEKSVATKTLLIFIPATKSNLGGLRNRDQYKRFGLMHLREFCKGGKRIPDFTGFPTISKALPGDLD
jgi:hypothetical protein